MRKLPYWTSAAVELVAVLFTFPKKPNNPPAGSEGTTNHKVGLEI